jgi:hypothetical protein
MYRLNDAQLSISEGATGELIHTYVLSGPSDVTSEDGLGLGRLDRCVLLEILPPLASF